jgi:rod shape-determining protein MreC
MRALFLLIYKFHFFFFFLVLEVFCIYLLVQNNNYQRASFVNSSNVLVGKFYDEVGVFNSFVNLKTTNKNLAEENARLRKLIADTSMSSKAVKVSVNDSLYKQQYQYITAHVINNSINRRSNYLTLNKGRADGVRREDGVIASNGAVGKVKYVSEHFCVVMSLLHKDTKISARIKKNKYSGELRWEGGSATQASLNDIAVHVPIAIGDTVVTSSYSPIYPEGITLGTIAHFELKPGQNFYNITVNLSTTFGNLTYVYIVNNLFKNEQVKLESEIPQHD